MAKRNEPAKTADEEYQLAKQFYEGRGQTVSEPTPFEDVDAIATTKAFATKNNLTTMEDLKKLGSFSLGARPEFKARQQGLAGMKKVYGIDNAKFRQLALGVQYQALDTGKVDTANIFTTDAQLASGKYTVLKDPKGVFGFQNVSFVIDKNKLAAARRRSVHGVINSVNKLLTTDAITAMNKAVAIDKQDEATVAKQFLTANNLTLRDAAARGRSAGPRPVDARAASTGATISRSVACGPSASIAVSRKPVASSATRSTSHTVEVSGGASRREIGWSPKPATATSPGIDSPSSAHAA